MDERVAQKPKRARKAKPAAPAMPSRQAVLDFIAASPEKVGKREIARAFGITGADRIELKRMLGEMAQDGATTARAKRIRTSGGVKPVAVVEIAGTTADGELWGRPLEWRAADGETPRILVAAGKGMAPGIGDHVLAKIAPARGHDYAYTATPIRTVPRERTRQLAVFRRDKAGGGILMPTDKKALKEWRIGADEAAGAADGELVRFEVAKTGRVLSPRARVIERLGRPEGPRAVSRIAVETHGIRDEFPPDALAELERLPKFSPRGREDLRTTPLVTIDPIDARDHDDAVFAEPDGGGWRVIVAIADVSFYVRPGSALGDEARARGNSTYFPDRVVPMLPEAISNDLCSLVEGRDRPCLAVEMRFGADGAKHSHRFIRAVMRSAAKLHYAEAQAAIDGDPSPKAAPLLGPLRALWAAYAALKAARDKRGPLDLDLPERKIVMDEAGVPSVIVPPRLDAHRLIEEFMIQANVAAAEALEEARVALIYRVHDAPSPEKLASLAEFLETIGQSIPKSGMLRPAQFNRVLGRVAGSEFAELVNTVVLRSQAQAEYSPGNLGHFGLNLRRYAHFTSPIRRYADLVVHRALVRAGKLGPGGLEDAEIADLSATAEHISGAERRSMAAERETIDRLVAQHLAAHVGATFAARVSGVTRVGLFVRLDETGADGFIPAGTLGRDYFAHDEARHALIGRATGETFRLGDHVEVRLIEVQAAAGALRFQMISEGGKAPPGARRNITPQRRPKLPKRPRKR